METSKKFKIIEIGRICSPDELKKITGGTCPDDFQGCNSYENCGLLGHVTCKVAQSSKYGYETTTTTTLCDVGYIYSSCEGSVFTACNGGKVYTS